MILAPESMPIVIDDLTQNKVYKLGPDVLWLLTENLGLVIEVKSRKDRDNALYRKQHGQLLNAVLT